MAAPHPVGIGVVWCPVWCMMPWEDLMKDYAKLVFYTRDELGTIEEYERYQPNRETTRRIAELLPGAHVEIVAAAWCKDCRREIPRFARLAERLNGWTIELLGDDPATRERLAVKRIPTFIIRGSADGPELGRIVESPSSGSLEADLLAIAQQHPSRILA
jgi:thiol-disulfide isomerase/thioredoxin